MTISSSNQRTAVSRSSKLQPPACLIAALAKADGRRHELESL
jgi:hypothetical protein